ncbi:MAG: hypothetical protein Q4B26_00865 [Eubacteriales bacterium]|nr:hypothetical protein [Eubacteriales bacterium]
MTGMIYDSEAAVIEDILGEPMQELKAKRKCAVVHRNYLMRTQPERKLKALIKAGVISEEFVTTRMSGIRFIYRLTDQGFTWLAKTLNVTTIKLKEE